MGSRPVLLLPKLCSINVLPKIVLKFKKKRKSKVHAVGDGCKVMQTGVGLGGRLREDSRKKKPIPKTTFSFFKVPFNRLLKQRQKLNIPCK